jgi:CheY-like chemotaxis protein
MPQLRRVTVVNDNPEFLELMQDLLQDASYPATLINGDRDNAMDLIEGSQPDILIIDLRLGTHELKGMDIVREVRRRPKFDTVPMLVCTADRWALNGLGDELEAMQGVGILPKPFAIDELYRSLEILQPS